MVKRILRKSEFRIPKPERNPKLEIRIPMVGGGSSGFGFRPSALGMRISCGLSDGVGLRPRRRTADDPIAIVKSAQVVRVETVAKICSQFHGPGGGRMGDASRDGAKAVSMFPGGLGTLLKFLDGQFRRTKNNVLTVVKFPVPGQNSAFRLQSLVKRGVGKRRDDGKSRQVNVRLYRKLRGLQKHIRPVVIEAKDETPLKCDAILMEALHDANKLFRRIKTFVILPEILR